MPLTKAARTTNMRIMLRIIAARCCALDTSISCTSRTLATTGLTPRAIRRRLPVWPLNRERSDRRRRVFAAVEAAAEAGKAPAAGRVLFAIAKQEFERALAVASHVEGQTHVGGGDAVEDYRAKRRGVAARVFNGGATAVRSTVEIDFGITEKPAHFVEIVHRDRGGVEPHISLGLVAGEAGAELLDGVLRV